MIGIIPAAGKAERMHGIPKMLLPVGETTLIQRLIACMGLVSVSAQVRIGISELLEELIDTIVYERGVVSFPMNTQTMSETVLEVRKWTEWGKDEPVLFGMPDTYFEDEQAFVKLAAELRDGADVAVGVFQTRPEQRHKLGMVEIAGCEVLHVIDKPAETDLTWAWGVLAWKPKFWNVIQANDPHVGYALPRALAGEMDVRAVRMDGGFWDAGTPDEYFDLITYLHEGVKA
jgi:NDP-sugar pyrophosphorylase family protein